MAGQVYPVFCGVCGGRTTFLFLQRGFEVWLCRHCRFVRMVAGKEAPAAVDYAKLYGDDYYGRGEHSSKTIVRYEFDDTLDSKLPQPRDAVKLIQGFKRRGRLLDMGCAAGVFVKAAQDAGFEAMGVDISPVEVQFARDRFGVDARVGTLDSVDFGPNCFDVITVWDVLEHFENPWRAAARARVAGRGWCRRAAHAQHTLLTHLVERISRVGHDFAA